MNQNPLVSSFRQLIIYSHAKLKSIAIKKELAVMRCAVSCFHEMYVQKNIFVCAFLFWAYAGKIHLILTTVRGCRSELKHIGNTKKYVCLHYAISTSRKTTRIIHEFRLKVSSSSF